MNIYSRKALWKRLLMIAGVLIVAASFWYTWQLINRIATEEREQVKLWAEAIQKKAKLVNYTNELFTELKEEERKKVELWLDATNLFISGDNTVDYTFISKVLSYNTTVPVILTDAAGKVQTYRNLDEEKAKDPAWLKAQIDRMAAKNEPLTVNYFQNLNNYLYYEDSRLFSDLKTVFSDLEKSFIAEIVANAVSSPVIYTNDAQTEAIAFGNLDSSKVATAAQLQEQLEDMRSHNEPISVELAEGQKRWIFYNDSDMLTRLKYFPVIQFGAIAIFILIAYLLFSTARRSEQNQVWVGMAKETAHQLGTPLSSMMGWLELLKTRESTADITEEFAKDIRRLETITARFSKIGSQPELQRHSLEEVLGESVTYFKQRSPKKISIDLQNAGGEHSAMLNVPLFQWVIENLIKNAIDAIESGEGKIDIQISQQGTTAYVDLTDTGKGISSSKFKTVFEPGFTTKKRGWGLGLSLTKRIIENYHNGKIFVKRSDATGTTFRIVLEQQ